MIFLPYLVSTQLTSFSITSSPFSLKGMRFSQDNFKQIFFLCLLDSCSCFCACHFTPLGWLVDWQLVDKRIKEECWKVWIHSGVSNFTNYDSKHFEFSLIEFTVMGKFWRFAKGSHVTSVDGNMNFHRNEQHFLNPKYKWNRGKILKQNTFNYT